ncbi:MAG: hypothetical protein NZM26_03740 [Patescibacteria group bacterium]|nr:hypothetical protein [Patescibacteria group bacterium]
MQTERLIRQNGNPNNNLESASYLTHEINAAFYEQIESSLARPKGFDKNQRIWLLLRDQGCAFQNENFISWCKKRGLSYKHKCSEELHCHHIYPKTFLAYSGFDELYINRAENGIVVCKFAHLNWIHPDMGAAMRNYRTNPDSIEQVFEKRSDLLKQGRKYWIDFWDDLFYALALLNTSQFVINHGIPYPIGKRSNSPNSNINGHQKK